MLESKRKGVELSMNAIIVMALALLVLAVTAFLLLTQTNIFGKETSCEGRGGTCELLNQPCPDATPVISPFSCSDKNKKCCTNIGAEE